MVKMLKLYLLTLLMWISICSSEEANNTCRNVVYNVHTLQQSCCTNGTNYVSGKAIEELKGQVATLQAKLQALEGQQSKKDISQKGCGSFKYYSCQSESDCPDMNTWYLDSKSSSKWPHSGLCRAISTTDPQTRGSYKISIDILGILGCHRAGCGHLGFLFNVQDPLNFEFVFFTPHYSPHCYRHGYYSNGIYKEPTLSTCRNGVPQMNRWFTVKMHIANHAKTALLYRDGGLVAQIHPHFPATRWGGAVVFNGYHDMAAFRNYKLISMI